MTKFREVLFNRQIAVIIGMMNLFGWSYDVLLQKCRRADAGLHEMRTNSVEVK